MSAPRPNTHLYPSDHFPSVATIVFKQTYEDFTITLYLEPTRGGNPAFGPDYRAAVAVSAEWCGKPGAAIDDPGSWRCFNSTGERVGSASRSAAAQNGIVVIEDADVDLRGAGVVEFADNTHVITRNGHRIALASLRANSVHLDGMLAVTDEINLSGKLGMKGGKRPSPSRRSWQDVCKVDFHHRRRSGDAHARFVRSAQPVSEDHPPRRDAE